MIALVAMAVNAQTVVTFDFDKNYASYFTTGENVSSGTGDAYVADGEFNEDQTITIDGVTLTIKASAEDAANRNRIWASSPRLRMYNESFTIAAPSGHKVTKITFNTGSNFNVSTTTGTLLGKDWGGEDSSVKFDVAKNTQIKSMTVTLDGSGSAPVDLTNTPETAYSVTKALELIEAGEGLDTKVYVKGTVSNIESIDTDKYGNASYYISDGSKELYIYRGYGLENKKFNEEGTKMFEEGDDVIVYGKLKDYVKDDVHTPEMDSGNYIYSLNGETENDPGAEPYVPTGDGSLANPYTAEDVKGLLGDNNAPTGSVWVKGTIVGTANSGTKLNSEADKEESKTNIALGSADVWVPVQLKTDSAPYNNINIVDNPDNLGKDVWVYGTVEAYFTVAGVKNVTNWSFDGVTTTINAVSATAANAAVYNLAGQRVNNNYKGAVIKNGNKFMVK